MLVKLSFRTLCIPALLVGMLVTGCSEDKALGDKINFDRKAMLENWADNIIIPAYSHFEAKSTILKQDVEAFEADNLTSSLNKCKASFLEVYEAFEKIKKWPSRYLTGSTKTHQ